MSDASISCPECGHSLTLTDVVTAPLKAQWQKNIESDLKAELSAALAQKEATLKQQEQQELELRKKLQVLESKSMNVDLELARRLDQERRLIQEEASRQAQSVLNLKLSEKDQQLTQMKETITALKNQSEQGSQQRQGEALELTIEQQLGQWFPLDDFQPVAKGVKGADLVQTVKNATGQMVGTILWEAKRTKAWRDVWVTKLKDDQRAIHAHCAVIISEVRPKDAGPLSNVEGVWVVDFYTIQGLASVLRKTLCDLHQAAAVAEGQDEKLGYLYRYLTGNAFKQRVEAIVESFSAMQADLVKEKRAIQKCWAAREKQIERLLDATVGMYGDIEGIVGAKALPHIEALSLEHDEAL